MNPGPDPVKEIFDLPGSGLRPLGNDPLGSVTSTEPHTGSSVALSQPAQKSGDHTTEDDDRTSERVEGPEETRTMLDAPKALPDEHI